MELKKKKGEERRVDGDLQRRVKGDERHLYKHHEGGGEKKGARPDFRAARSGALT